MTIRVPDDMSLLDAFSALYNHAEPAGQGRLHPSSGEQPRTSDEAARLLHVYCYREQCDYVRGKRLKVDFSGFPWIKTKKYDAYYGEGAAHKALNAYQTPPHGSSMHKDPCASFSDEQKNQARPEELHEFRSWFKSCPRIQEIIQHVEQQLAVPHNPPTQAPGARCAVIIEDGPFVNVKPCDTELELLKQEMKTEEGPSRRPTLVCRESPKSLQCIRLPKDTPLPLIKIVLEQYNKKEGPHVPPPLSSTNQHV